MVPELRERLHKSAVFKELLTPLKVMPHVPENNSLSSPPKNAYVCWWVTPFQAVKLTNQVNQDSLIVEFSKQLCTDNEVRKPHPSFDFDGLAKLVLEIVKICLLHSRSHLSHALRATKMVTSV